MGLNLLARPGESPELVVDQVVSIFHDLYRDSWGPRTDDILRAALLTLVGVPGMTLTEVPLLLTDPGFREPLVGAAERPGGARAVLGLVRGPVGRGTHAGHRASHEQAADLPAAPPSAQHAGAGRTRLRLRPGAGRAKHRARAAR